MVFLDGIGGKGGALQEGKKFALYIDREVQSIDTRKWELGSSQTKGVKGTTHRTEGDHDGYAPLTRAAIPVTWGHAMEVPERMLKCLSSLAGDHAANMFSPGAAISGYRMH
uniref:Uncharacterized protein n=1 Tax=Oryza meridionalis TaxID=40149 RepID=A0A0E0C914_9ORYZ